MTCKVVLTFESVDETLLCDHSTESYLAVLSSGTVYYDMQGGSTFWDCGWNFGVRPFKWKLFSSTFQWYCAICFLVLLSLTRLVFLASTGKTKNDAKRWELQHTAVTDWLKKDGGYVDSMSSSHSAVDKFGELQRSSNFREQHYRYQATVMFPANWRREELNTTMTVWMATTQRRIDSYNRVSLREISVN